jgi:hypothetical protein
LKLTFTEQILFSEILTFSLLFYVLTTLKNVLPHGTFSDMNKAIRNKKWVNFGNTQKQSQGWRRKNIKSSDD